MISGVSLIVLLQIICAIHLLRRQGNLIWLLPIIAMPVLGCVLYIVFEMRGDLRRGGVLADVSLPGHERRRIVTLQRELAHTDTGERRAELAQLLLKNDQPAEALSVIADVCAGPLRASPYLMHIHAQVLHANGRFAEMRTVLEKMDTAGFAYKAKHRRLLWALCLLGLGEREAGEVQLIELHRRFDGEEASYRYVELLLANDRADRAQQVERDMRACLREHGGIYRRQEQHWQRKAAQAIARWQLTQKAAQKVAKPRTSAYKR